MSRFAMPSVPAAPVPGRLRAIDAAAVVATAWLLCVVIPVSMTISGSPEVFLSHGLSAVGWLVAVGVASAVTVAAAATAALAITRLSARTSPWVGVGLVALLCWLPLWGAASRLVTDRAVLSVVLGVVLSVGAGLLATRPGLGGPVVVITCTGVLLGNAVALRPMLGTTPTISVSPAAAVAHPPSVLWILLDEASANAMTDEGGRVHADLPHLRALQQTATSYRGAYSVFPHTEIAVPAMMAGITDVSALSDTERMALTADEGALPVLAGSYDMVIPGGDVFCRSFACETAPGQRSGSAVARLLADTAAIAAHVAMPETVARSFPPVTSGSSGFWSSADEPDLGAFLDGRGDSTRPWFAFVHSFAVHSPWLHDEDGSLLVSGRRAPWGRPFGACAVTASMCTTGIAGTEQWLYENGLVAADQQVGQAIADLEERGLFDDTLIIVTADHGAAIAAGQDVRRPATLDLRTDVAHVPLLVKYPHQSWAATVTEPRSTGQIIHTVLDLAGLGAAVPGPGLGETDPAARFAAPAVDASDFSVSTVDRLGALASAGPGAFAPERVELAPTPELDASWAQVQQTAVVTAASDGARQAVSITTPDRRCLRSGGLTGLVVTAAGSASVAWEDEWTDDGVTGWAVVPTGTTPDLRVYCPAV